MNSNPLYGLIGRELSHSFSPAYFAEKFKINNIHAQYHPFSIPQIESFPDLIQQYSFSGLNVTIPYKQAIIEYLDELDPAAEKIGAVNTICFTSNKLVGYNTDHLGFSKSLKSHLNPLRTWSALVLGTGGASKAIQFALEQLNINYQLVSRNPKSNQIHYSDLQRDVIERHLLIINTTPIGTYPDVDQAPDIPYRLLTENHILFDLVYNPPMTSFMKFGAKMNTKTINGYDMLVYQADQSWEIWQTNS